MAAQAPATALEIPADAALWPMLMLDGEALTPRAPEQDCEGGVWPPAAMDAFARCLMGRDTDIAVCRRVETSLVMDPVENALFIE